MRCYRPAIRHDTSLILLGDENWESIMIPRHTYAIPAYNESLAVIKLGTSRASDTSTNGDRGKRELEDETAEVF